RSSTTSTTGRTGWPRSGTQWKRGRPGSTRSSTGSIPRSPNSSGSQLATRSAPSCGTCSCWAGSPHTWRPDRPATTLAGCGPGLSSFASTGAPAHPLDVQQHDRLGRDAQPTTQRELGEGLVDRLPRGTDQLGEFLLSEVVVDVQSVLALL